jgi:hypothetical protein
LSLVSPTRAYQHGSSVRLDNLPLAIASNHGFPDLVKGRSVVLIDYCEQRAIPPCHSIRLFVPKHQVLKVLFRIPALRGGVGQKTSVVFTALVDRRADMNLPLVRQIVYLCGVSSCLLPRSLVYAAPWTRSTAGTCTP